LRAMVLERVGEPLVLRQRPDPEPGPSELLIRVEACGVCRTDLHVVDGELPDVRPPIVPGHEVVGRIVQSGAAVEGVAVGARVGVAWLGRACGHCSYCRDGRENLCDEPAFTGYNRDGGYATHIVAEAAFVTPLPDDADAAATAPLLCAGLIGWRALKAAGPGRRIGLYGFGAAAHILAQICRAEGREVYAFTRPGDDAAQSFARRLGVAWAGGSDQSAPAPLDAAILFAPVGALVPAALRATRKGARVVCAGIHMSDIPSFPYRWLWEERQIVSVANLTRADAAEFFAVARRVDIRTEFVRYRLEDANRALADLREGRLQGAAVLIP